MMEDMAFGEMIRQARKRAGMTQVELAAAVGVDHTYVCKMERSALALPPSEEAIRALCRVLDVAWFPMLEASGRTVEIPVAYLVALKDALDDQVMWRVLTRSHDLVSFLDAIPAP